MIKAGVMLMNNRGPDGQPTDWKAELAAWKKLGLEGVDIFHRMLENCNETPASIKVVLDDLGLEPTVFCVPTDFITPGDPISK